MMAPRVNAATRRGLLHSGGAGDAKDGERFLDSLGRRDPSCARRLFFSMEGVLGILTDNVNHPAHYEAGPFECVELTRLYPFMGGNAIKYVYRHRLKGRGAEDLRKALWYLDHAEPDELRPSYTRRDVRAFGAVTPPPMSSMRVEPGCEEEVAGMVSDWPLDLAHPDNGATHLLRVLERADWQGMAPFWKGMWELARGHDSGLTRAKRAVARRISLLESDYSDDELRLLDGWSAPPAAMWRLRARGMEL